MDYQGALAVAKGILDCPPHYGIVDIGRADDFWAFYGGYLDGIDRDLNPSIVVVMKESGEIIQPQIPSADGFALLDEVTSWIDGE